MPARTWDEYLTGSGPTLTSTITGEEDRGLVGRFSDWYDQGIGKRWLPEPESYLGPMEERLRGTLGERGAKIAMLGNRATAHAADFLFGSPADTASTALTLGTLGAAAPWVYGGKAVQLASKAPKLYKAAQTGARAVDAIQSARAGSHAIESAVKGDVKGTLLGTAGAVLGGYGASAKPYDAVSEFARQGRIREARKALDEINARPGPTTRRPESLALANRPVAPPGTVDLTNASVPSRTQPPIEPAFLRPTKPPVVAQTPTEEFWSPFTASDSRFAPRAEPVPTAAPITPANRNVIFQSQQPNRIANLAAPITDESRLLPERTFDANPPHPTLATVEAPDAIMERARRDLAASGQEVTPENLARYIGETDESSRYRAGTQSEATRLGQPGAYEATVASRQVTPGVRGTIPDQPAIAPSTRATVEEAGTRLGLESEPIIEGLEEAASATPVKRTYYIKPEDISLLETPGPKGSKVTIRERTDGTLGSWLERGKVKGFMKHHRAGGFVKPLTTPEPGLIPVEVGPDGTFRVGQQLTPEAAPVPTTPQRVSGLRQTLAEPALASRPVERGAPEIRQALASRGVTEPTEEMVQRIVDNPKLLDKVVPPTDEFVPDVASGFRPVTGPVDESRMIGSGATPLPQTLDEFIATAGKTGPEVYGGAKVKRRAPLDRGVMAKLQDIVHNSPNLPEREAAEGVLKRQMMEEARAGQPGRLGNAIRGIGMTMEEEFKRIGPTAERVGMLITRKQTDAPLRYNEFVQQTISPEEIRWARKNPEEFAKVVDYVEGTTLSLPANLKDLGDRIRATANSTGDEMVELGLIDKKRADYWTHNFEGVPDATVKEHMRKAGFSEDEITARLEGIRKNAEMKISEEYSRSALGIPGYRKDVDVLLDHFKDVANRLEHARNFGAKDITDPNSPISKLIAASEAPERVRDLAQRSIRGPANVSETMRDFTRGARDWATMSQLSLAAISNMGGLVPVAVRGKLRDTASALMTGLRNAAPETKVINNVSEFRNFNTAFGEAMRGSDKLYHKFGITGTQNLLNRVAGSVGSATAETLFNKLKAGKLGKNGRKQLEDLTVTSPDELLKQDKLTDRQVQRSMVRMTDITQGSINHNKLPYHWVRSDVLTVPQIFMRIAVQSSKSIKDAIEENPANLMKLVGAGAVVGEIVGDTKELAKTGAQIGANEVQQWMGLADEDKDFATEYGKNVGWSNDEDDESYDRMSFTRQWLSKVHPAAAENEYIVRSISNLENAFALGLPGDILSGFAEDFDTRDPNELLAKTVAGTFWGADEAGQIVGAVKNVATGNFRDAGRYAVKRIPFVGRGVAREIDTTYQQKQKENGGAVTGWPMIE